MTMWHLDDVAVQHWVDGTGTLPQSGSVEQHLVGCEPCRERVGTVVRDQHPPTLPSFDEVWRKVRDAVELPTPSRFERALRRMGLPAADARLVCAAQAFRGPWMTGVLLVLTFVTLAAEFGQNSGHVIFLAVAPLLPCVGVALSYDPSIERALEQELVTPYSAMRLVLLRSVAVLLVGLPAVVLLSPLMPDTHSYLWLVPAAGFVAAVLALSTWINPLPAAGAISGTWFAVVFSIALNTPVGVVLDPPFQAGYGAIALLSLAVFLARGRHLRELRPRGGWL